MLKLLARVVGFVLLFIGIIGVLTPIPFGLVFIMLALMFLVPTTPAVPRAIARLRRKSNWLDEKMFAITRKMPMPYRRILRETEHGDL